ncbi:hypothetical protein B0H03_10464 [Rathayibacter iranicus NCPPB 2253 = VKM Ac-1602]|uniref:Lipoprotein n=1 Tax=Rathayibacter iranicus NCPPB 2253 = VKM Ac-1602 TaxID=1328868 RepID=A0ABX5LDR9_9MICO|nr:hypothetical protein B0H03_10464 [Rathayibacter iranicus NCPPB 2253 = VKM Ac-1602]
MIERRTRPWLRTVLSAVLATALLASCGAGTQVSPEDNRLGVVEFVRDSAAVVPGDGWSTREGSPRASVCELDWGQKGARFVYNYWAFPGSDRDADAQRVAEYWRSLGMSVRVTDSTPWPTVYGEGGPVLRASFDTHSPWDGRYSLGAVSWCRPGDSRELNRSYQRRLAEGEVQPGDEPSMSQEDRDWKPSSSDGPVPSVSATPGPRT